MISVLSARAFYLHLSIHVFPSSCMSNPKDVLREGLLETLRQCQHLTAHEIDALSDDLRILETANDGLKDEYLAASERFMDTMAKQRISAENCEKLLLKV